MAFYPRYDCVSDYGMYIISTVVFSLEDAACKRGRNILCDDVVCRSLGNDINAWSV